MGSSRFMVGEVKNIIRNKHLGVGVCSSEGSYNREEPVRSPKNSSSRFMVGEVKNIIRNKHLGVGVCSSEGSYNRKPFFLKEKLYY